MINISTRESKVKINVSTTHGRSLDLFWETGDPFYAILVKESIEQVIGNRLEAIRREAYSSGWKDDKAKRAKATWFARWW